MAYNVLVDKEKCTGCGECADVCPVSVYELRNNKSVPVKAEDCIGCEACAEVCPAAAITIEEA
ncbi:MAG: 4Fe-4S dicluster domain-containing protein [Deltaproteobacteria bacterium]|jgi:NAD-dependent dihydropyrimidine dehydrogenase PreA subunit|nr:4Fe-4S dicluster domain-containing protein [Deltaproteobacteria bacterium]